MYQQVPIKQSSGWGSKRGEYMLWLLRRPIDGHPSPDGLIGAVGKVVPPAANRWRHVGRKGEATANHCAFFSLSFGATPAVKIISHGPHVFLFLDFLGLDLFLF